MEETHYEYLTEAIKSILDLTARIDERVLNMTKKQEILEQKLDILFAKQNELDSRVKILESKDNKSIQEEVAEIKESLLSLSDYNSRLKIVELSFSRQENWWKTILNFAMQLAWVVMAAYVLYKLGLQVPQTP
jgi:uncharacterized protein YdcH (DUF465 family)